MTDPTTPDIGKKADDAAREMDDRIEDLEDSELAPDDEPGEGAGPATGVVP